MKYATNENKLENRKQKKQQKRDDSTKKVRREPEKKGLDTADMVSMPGLHRRHGWEKKRPVNNEKTIVRVYKHEAAMAR